jgi:hypothetical protein
MTWNHGESLANDPSITELLERLPDRLYKFSGLSGDRLDWMKRLIVGCELYFATPSSFNDPLDCRVTARFEAPAEVVQKHWLNVGLTQFPNADPMIREARVRELVAESETAEGQARHAQQLIDILALNGTVCFAKDPTNVLLWSYYAQSHTGIAIEFRFDLDHYYAFATALEAQRVLPFPVEVAYAETFPSINYYTSTTHERLRGLLGTKAHAWKHEGEWRIVLANRSGYLSVPPGFIKAVILGMRISPEHEATVRRWVTDRRPAVELRRVRHRPNSFQLEIVPA